MNPFGKHFSMISVSDLLLVNHHGEVVEGNDVVNRAAFAIHSQIHAARPDVIAAAHCHSMHGKAWSSLGRTARPDHAGRVRVLRRPRALRRLHGRRPRHRGGQAHRARPRRGNKAAILRNHGLLTVGETVDEAVWWFITMDRSCQAQLLAEAAGKPILIDEDDARLTYTQVGSHLAGWFSFQPMYEMIVAQQPDLLD